MSIPKPFTVPTVFKTVTKAAWFDYPIKVSGRSGGIQTHGTLLGFFRLVIGHFKSLSHAPVFISYRKGVVCKVKIEVFRDFIAQFVLLSTDSQRGTLSFGLARCFSNQKCHSCMQLNSTSRIKLLITNLANPFYSIWNICTATRYYYLILFYVFVKRNNFISNFF